VHKIPKLFQSYYDGDVFPYSNVVIWGLRNKDDTFRYIWRHFYDAFKALSIPVEWVDDDDKYRSLIKKNTLVLGVNVAGQQLPVVKGAYYCLHNFDGFRDLHDQIEATHNIRLQVYTNEAEAEGNHSWNQVTWFSKKERKLFQPWGTSVLPQHFGALPLLSVPIVFWVGSIWNNKQNQGNIEEIKELKAALRRNNIRFKHMHHVSESTNRKLVRISSMAPAIGGAWQVQNNYMPCRVFKNISYGMPIITNIAKFNTILKTPELISDNIGEIVENYYKMSRSEKNDILHQQQSVVMEHTYITKISNIVRAFEGIQ
jgi:hypothetical protein